MVAKKEEEMAHNNPAVIGDWPLCCHNLTCLWMGKVKEVYNGNGLLQLRPGCECLPIQNGFMADYAEHLKKGRK